MSVAWRTGKSVGELRRNAPIGFIRPCAPIQLGKPPLGPGWVHEVKADGYRLCARKDGSQVRLWTRLQNECSDRFTAIRKAVEALPVHSVTIDGEAVVRGSDGHCRFHALRTADGARRAELIAFDLLELNGVDLRREPIERRRARLAGLCGGVILFSEGFDAEGALVFEHACELGLEGIVSKRRGSNYQSGRSWSWVKTLNPDYMRV